MQREGFPSSIQQLSDDSFWHTTTPENHMKIYKFVTPCLNKYYHSTRSKN